MLNRMELMYFAV